MAKSSPSRSHNALGNSLLVLSSILVLSMVLEIALRIAGYNPFGEFFASQGRAVFIRPSSDPLRIFEATPNANGHGWGTDITINSFGFRGPEVLENKPARVQRVAVIGDSIAFGNNLPLEDNFSSQLQARYTNSQQAVEVLNFGLGGYDTLQEVATLKSLGLRFEPDHVVLAYCINDIGIASGNLDYIKRLQHYGKHPIYRLRLAQFIRVQLDKIALQEFTRDANNRENFLKAYGEFMTPVNNDKVLAGLLKKLQKQLKGLSGQYAFTHIYTTDIYLQRLRFALEKLKSLQTEHQFTVTVVIFPFLIEDEQSQPVYQTIYQIIDHEMQRLNFSTIHLYGDYQKTGLEQLRIKEKDGVHPNREGHRLAAEKLYETISF